MVQVKAHIVTLVVNVDVLLYAVTERAVAVLLLLNQYLAVNFIIFRVVYIPVGLLWGKKLDFLAIMCRSTRFIILNLSCLFKFLTCIC